MKSKIVWAGRCVIGATFVLATALTAYVTVDFAHNANARVREKDFSVFHSAGQMARRGDFADLYRADPMLAEQRQIEDGREAPYPFPYSATVAVLMIPFTLVPYVAAYVIFLGLSLLALVVIACISWRVAAPAPWRQRSILIGLLVTCYAAVATLVYGKFDTILAIPLLLGWELPLVLKPQFFGGVLPWRARSREWRRLAAIAVVGAAIYLWPLLVEPSAVWGVVRLNLGFFSGNEGYANTFSRSGPTLFVWMVVAVATMPVAWRIWGRGGGKELLFLLPLLVTPWPPSAIILVGFGAVIISRGVSTAALITWGWR